MFGLPGFVSPMQIICWQYGNVGKYGCIMEWRPLESGVLCITNVENNNNNTNEIAVTKQNRSKPITGTLVTSSPFYKHESTLISTWISNYIHYDMCGENT